MLSSAEIAPPGNSDTPIAPIVAEATRCRRQNIFAAFLITAAIVGLSIWGCAKFKHDFLPKHWGVVEPGRIYRSGQLSESVIEQTLRRNRIAFVVDLTGDEEKGSEQRAMQLNEQAVIARLGIGGGKYPLSGDGTGDIRRYADALTAIHSCVQEGKTVLIHCSAGTHRTGATVVFYRMLVQGKPGREAFAEIQQYGWSPTKHAVLAEYVNGHMRELAQLLVQRCVISRVPEPLPKFGP